MGVMRRPDMFKGVSTPPSFSLIQKGDVCLLIRDEYKDLLLGQGIEDIEGFLKKKEPVSRHLMGRTLHPCVPIKEGEWMVVRRYSHGGLFRGITRDLYLFGSRSFRETALTEEIRTSGIPTVQPVGAIHHRVFPFFYRACILSLEIPSARDLAQYLQEVGPHPVGETLSRQTKDHPLRRPAAQTVSPVGFFSRRPSAQELPGFRRYIFSSSILTVPTGKKSSPAAKS